MTRTAPGTSVASVASVAIRSTSGIRFDTCRDTCDTWATLATGMRDAGNPHNDWNRATCDTCVASERTHSGGIS